MNCSTGTTANGAPLHNASTSPLPDRPRFLHPVNVGLISLLAVELVALSVQFDTEPLSKSGSGLAAFVGSAPQFLRVMFATAFAMLLLGGRDFVALVASGERQPAFGVRYGCLVLHFVSLATFALITSVLLSVAVIESRQAPVLVAAWLLSGTLALLSWVLTLSRSATWIEFLRRRPLFLPIALAVGAGVWATGIAATELWQRMAGVTFVVARSALSLVVSETISDPTTLRLGTPSFKVTISSQCSGIEGVGLIVCFLSAYLWLYRRELRFPNAFLLLPIGAVCIWFLNVARIVALILIGNAGWRDIALGGFHSQAGWIAFNALALLFVAFIHLGGAFSAREHPIEARVASDDQTIAYLAPFAVLLATAMFTGAFSGGFDWLYPLRVVAVGLVLWWFREHYRTLRWSISPRALTIAVATFIVWLALAPSASAKDAWPEALSTVPTAWANLWLGFRIIGYILIVPVAEELAFRGYLTRRILNADISRVPLGVFAWPSFVVSSALFGLMHNGMWLAGTIAGMAFCLTLYQRRAIGDAVQAHAAVNALLAIYALTTGRWSVWS